MSFIKTWLWMMVLLLASKPALAKETPILPLDANDCCVPLLQGILVDPTLLSELPKSEEALARLVAQIEADKKALPKAKNKEWKAKRIIDSLAVKAAYWQLKDDGTKLFDTKAKEKAQKDLLSFAPIALKVVRNSKQKQAMLFPVMLTQYLVNPKLASKGLMSLKTNDPRQVDLLEFLQSFDAVSRKEMAAVKTLEDKAARVSKKASIVAALIKAKVIAQNKGDFHSELRYASRLCQDLSLSDREKIFRFSLGVWTKSPDFMDQWEPVPFQVNCFQETKGFAAMLERLAIFARNEGRLDKAIAYYNDAVQKTATETQKADLSTKAAETLRQVYETGAGREDYQNYLILSEGRFHSLSQGVRFLQMHDDLVLGEIAKRQGTPAKPEHLLDLRQVYDRYIGAAAFSPAARKVRATWVDLLEKNQQYDEAIDGLMSLAKGSMGIVREKYLRHAIALQTSSLKVDASRPWNFPDVKDSRQLSRLASIMDMLEPFNQGQVAFAIIRSRVSEKLGLVEDARIRFKTILPTAPDANDRNQIFTSLLFSAMAAQDFPEVESMIELSLRMNYKLTQALPDKKTMKDLYIETIVYLVHDSFSHSNWAASRQKMDKIIGMLPASSLHNEILYLKARAFQNERHFNDALTVLDIIEQSTPLDETWKQATLDKAALNLAQGNLEASVRSYEIYLQKAPDGDRLLDVRKSLVDLYLGMDQYLAARKNILILLKSDDTDDSQKSLLSDKLISLHKHLGQDPELKADIAFVSQLEFENRSALAQLLNLLGKRNQTIAQSEKFFQEQDRSMGAVSDFLSESAYASAKRFAAQQFAKVQSSYKAESEPVPEALRGAYQAVAKEFMKACDVPSSSYCAPALSEVDFEAKRYQQWLTQAAGSKSSVETRELDSYFSKEAQALAVQLNDAVNRGNVEARWFNTLGLENQEMWRFLGIASQNGITRLDIPQDLPGQPSLNFSQGVAQ
ncbi:MAG: hypothetical protein H7318_07985 [Oligoflexus sp.]|nr:hypothetical protein [Oligoflexus sp.]